MHSLKPFQPDYKSTRWHLFRISDAVSGPEKPSTVNHVDLMRFLESMKNWQAIEIRQQKHVTKLAESYFYDIIISLWNLQNRRVYWF